MVTYSGDWFNTAYNESNAYNPTWYQPTTSVYPVDISQIPSILTSNLLTSELIKYLSYFIQLVSRFNHRIDIYNNFIYSDQDLFKKSFEFFESNPRARESFTILEHLVDNEPDTKLKFYLRHVYYLQKMIHTQGIGDNTLFGTGLPTLHYCFLKIKDLLKFEMESKSGFFQGSWTLIFLDVILFLLPLLIILLFILQFIQNHFLLIIY